MGTEVPAPPLLTQWSKSKINKNDNNHKNEAQDQTNIDKSRVAANISEYHICQNQSSLELLFQNS